MATDIEVQCQRIADNVRRALAAIAEKGGTVPDGANSNDLEELIAGIESAKVASGTITTNKFNFQKLNGSTFACPFIPKIFILVDNKESVPSDYLVTGLYKDSKWYILSATDGTLSVKSGAPNSGAFPSFSLSGETLTMSCYSNSSGYPYLTLCNGRTFFWCAIG